MSQSFEQLRLSTPLSRNLIEGICPMKLRDRHFAGSSSEIHRRCYCYYCCYCCFFSRDVCASFLSFSFSAVVLAAAKDYWSTGFDTPLAYWASGSQCRGYSDTIIVRTFFTLFVPWNLIRDYDKIYRYNKVETLFNFLIVLIDWSIIWFLLFSSCAIICLPLWFQFYFRLACEF